MSPMLQTRLGLLAILLVVPACQQKMAQQPYYRPFDESKFFPDGSSARKLEKGVVARGQLLDSDPLVSGLKPDVLKQWGDKEWVFNIPEAELNKPLPGAPSDPAKFVDEFPFEITKEDLHRGQERYQIYCIACHGPLGNGKGKVAERGYLKPTSYHTFKLEENEASEPDGDNKTPKGYSRGFARFRQNVSLSPFKKAAEGDAVAPVGYFFEVVTKGYGGMPSYASQIPPADRWRIIAYIRALQQTLATTDRKVNEAAPKKAEEPKKSGGTQ